MTEAQWKRFAPPPIRDRGCQAFSEHKGTFRIEKCNSDEVSRYLKKLDSDVTQLYIDNCGYTDFSDIPYENLGNLNYILLYQTPNSNIDEILSNIPHKVERVGAISMYDIIRSTKFKESTITIDEFLGRVKKNGDDGLRVGWDEESKNFYVPLRNGNYILKIK